MIPGMWSFYLSCYTQTHGIKGIPEIFDRNPPVTLQITHMYHCKCEVLLLFYHQYARLKLKYILQPAHNPTKKKQFLQEFRKTSSLGGCLISLNRIGWAQTLGQVVLLSVVPAFSPKLADRPVFFILLVQKSSFLLVSRKKKKKTIGNIKLGLACQIDYHVR